MAQYTNLTPQQLERLRNAFHELKAEQDPILRQQQSRTFVHTNVYHQVRNEGRCLLVGRKGAGKTAMLMGFRQENADAYLTNASIEIIADEFPLEPLFNFFFVDLHEKAGSKKGGRTDLAQFLDQTRVATFAWKHSLLTCALFMASSRLLDIPELSEQLSTNERKILENTCNQIVGLYDAKANRRSVANGGSLLSSLLIYNVGTLPEMIQGIIEEDGLSNWAGTIAKITSKLGNFLKQDMVESLRKPMMQVRHILQRFDKKVLLTLDRFDDFYDEFLYRRDDEQDGEQKKEFLTSLLKGLILAARDLQRDSKEYGWMHMIFTIPADKFIELRLRERADLESNHVIPLQWSPIELREMVNRRIAYALDLPESDIPRAWNLLFPFEVTNGRVRRVRENSFLYIVRHSLWNPREIQMYLKAIFAEIERTKQPADEELFRRVVSTETERIIRGEFVGQFQGEYHGLTRLLNKLGNVQLQTLMQYEDLCDKLSGVVLFEGCRTSDQTVLRLFHMGVIGVRVNARRDWHHKQVIMQEKQEVAYRFCYNCDESDPFATTCEICFHPMFFEYLNLSHQRPYVINQLTWDMFE
jgi:hypothetical protein